MAAGTAAHAGEAVGEQAAGEVAAEVALDEAGKAAAVGALVPGVGEEALEVLADDAVEDGSLGLAAAVGGGELRAGGSSRPDASSSREFCGDGLDQDCDGVADDGC